MFVPGDRLKYWAVGMKQHGIGTLFPSDSEEYRRKTLFAGKTARSGWKSEIGRARFQEAGLNHPKVSGPIVR